MRLRWWLADNAASIAVAIMLVLTISIMVWTEARDKRPTFREWCSANGGHAARFGRGGDTFCVAPDGRYIWPDVEIKR